MLGVPDSCGVGAPCLTYHDGIFYLIYTNVQSFDGEWKDMPNYVVTTDDICGEWSKPVYLNSSGFDASFFHDDDGRTWLTNMIMDHRDNRSKLHNHIARVLFTVQGDRMILLHEFIKKSQKTPANQLQLAKQRLSLLKEQNDE